MTFEEFISEWQNGDSSIPVRTSGSTGVRKTIRLQKDFMRESASRTNSFFNIDSESRLHSCISPEYIGGKMMAVRADIANAVLSWEIPSNQPLLNLEPSEKIDLLAVVPSQMDFILRNLDRLPRPVNIIIGGAPIPPELRNRIARSGLEAYETYGMTETASHIALRKVSDENLPFTTLPGIKVTSDESGALVIKFSSGYSLVTNDMAELISEREFFIKGRKDNVIITGGKKLNPEEIEEKISHLIPIPFMIIGVPDEKWGEKVVLVLEYDPYDVSLSNGNVIAIESLADRNNLKSLLSGIIEDWQIPRETIYVKQLPRTSNGKIIRKLSFY